MKMKKMIGAFALTAALAMGTAPAFAASATTPDPATDAFSDNGSTEIKAKVDNINPQVRATVPLQVTVVFGSNGGSDIVGPNSSAYKITNVGEGNIKLTEAEITDVNTVFTTTEMGTFGENKFKTYDGNNMEWNEITSGDHLNFTFKADTFENYLTVGHKASEAKGNAKEKLYVENATAWPAGGISIAKGADLPIELGGVAYFTSTFTQDNLTDTLCKIKYTIASA